jgi:glycine/D-amino acid oxidase-like deaminating enzyme
MERTDVLVIGGGVLGCATAYHLARRGRDVLVVERGQPNREASGASAGTLHVQMPGPYFRAHYDQGVSAGDRARLAATDQLYAEAARRWRTLEAALGADLGVRLHGGLMVAETAEGLAALERKSRLERPFGIQTEILGVPDLRAMAPCLSARLAGAAYCAEEGFANPLLVAPAYLRAASSLGARYRLDTRVDAIESRAGGGFVVHTPPGRIGTGRIVCAAGAQTGAIAAMVGLDLPVQPHPLQVMVTERCAPVLSPLVQHGERRLSLRQTPHGTFVIGGGWPALADDATGPSSPMAGSITGSARVAVDVLPCLQRLRLVRAWAAMTTATSPGNRVGIIGQSGRAPGFFVLVSSGWGFTLSPVLGEVAAELASDAVPSLPVEAFEPEQCVGEGRGR